MKFYSITYLLKITVSYEKPKTVSFDFSVIKNIVVFPALSKN